MGEGFSIGLFIKGEKISLSTVPGWGLDPMNYPRNGRKFKILSMDKVLHQLIWQVPQSSHEETLTAECTLEFWVWLFGVLFQENVKLEFFQKQWII